jgi:hypothetical protein
MPRKTSDQLDRDVAKAVKAPARAVDRVAIAALAEHAP